jgi:hypothetical protein
LGDERKADDLDLKKNYCREIRSSENRMTNLAEFSKEGYGSKRALFSITIMMNWKCNGRKKSRYIASAIQPLLKRCNGNHPNNKGSWFWAVIRKWNLPNTWQECQQNDPVISRTLSVLQLKPKSCKQPQRVICRPYSLLSGFHVKFVAWLSTRTLLVGSQPNVNTPGISPVCSEISANVGSTVQVLCL